MAETFANIGNLHAVVCEWCGLRMSCNCWDGNDPEREGHLVVLCPRCQVTDFLNLLFGGQTRREILLSKIGSPATATTSGQARKPPTLRLLPAKRSSQPAVRRSENHSRGTLDS